MELKWLGQSGFKIDDLLIDPWLTPIESWNLPAPHTWTAEDKEAKTMVITHNHEDHCNGAFDLAKEKKMTLVGNTDTVMPAAAKGISVDPLSIGGGIETNGWKINLTQATHGIDATGAVLEKDGIVIYHAGDTGLFGDMKLIGQLFKPDVAILPIGGRFTMDEEQAAIAASYLGAKLVIPMHFNTFPMIQADPKKFAALVKEKCKSQVKILEVGEEMTL